MSTTIDSKAADASFFTQLNDEIERLKRRLQPLEEARKAYIIDLGLDDEIRPLAARDASNNSKNGNNDKAPTISQVVEGLIHIAPDQQMHLDEILKRLKKRGILITRKNLANTLNRWLTRKKRFQRVAQSTYGLR